jgi:hypothetical protein
MAKIWIKRTYDIRPIDFTTGKRIPVANNAKKECDCCGKKIVKVTELNNGQILGSECAEFVEKYPQYSAKFLGMTDKQVEFYNRYI